MVKAQQATVAKMVDGAMRLSGKTLVEIASEMGYEHSNILTMIRKGDTKMPINKIVPFAKSTGLDPVHALRITLGEYQPETWAVIEQLFGNVMVTDNEMEIIRIMRDVAKGHDVAPANDQERLEFKDLVLKWRKREEALAKAAKNPKLVGA